MDSGCRGTASQLRGMLSACMLVQVEKPCFLLRLCFSLASSDIFFLLVSLSSFVIVWFECVLIFLLGFDFVNLPLLFLNSVSFIAFAIFKY